jgi:hypothetical protein
MTDLKRAPKGAASDSARLEFTPPNDQEAVDPNLVTVRILPLGDGKVADGTHGASPDRFGHYKHGDQPKLPREIAQALEAKGWVEITGDA